MKIKDEKISEDQFLNMRKEVLSAWPTGTEVDLDEAVKYLENLPKEKNFAYVLEEADKKGISLTQPRAGVPLVDEHIELLKHLQDEGGADLLPTTIDAYTRLNRYEEGERGIEESRKAGRSMMNGFPVVNHGVKTLRKVTEALNLPIEARHGTPDSRLLSEIIHAGGFTSNEGGAISYNFPYAKQVPMERTIRHWQYCDRLAGYYTERGVTINREPFGPLTGTLVPPSNSNSVAIIEALLAARQGVKSITVGYGQCGNLNQDVAAIIALREQAKEYLSEYGFDDVYVTTVFHQWMGGFPEDESRAFGLISLGTTAGALAGATKIIVKTPHEAVGIPTKEANADGIKATKTVLGLLEGQRLSMSADLEEEICIIKAETKSIVDKVYQLGNEDFALGTVKACEVGVIDIPFAPSVFNQGKVMPARDAEGAIRYFETGNLPFSKDLIEYNRGKIEERAKKQGKKVSFQLTVDDVFAVSEGKLIG